MGILSNQILELLKQQYVHELTNYKRYIQFSSWCRFRGFENTGNFFASQAKDEISHAEKVQKYIEDRNEQLYILDTPVTYAKIDFFDELFTNALEVERSTTETLERIYAESLSLSDYMTIEWIRELLVEQIAEENEFQTIIDRIVQRGGGGKPDDAISLFRKELAGAHDLDVLIGEME